VGVVVRQLVKGDRGAICRILQTSGTFTSAEIDVALELVDSAIARGLDGDYIAFTAIREMPDSSSHDDVSGYVCIGPTPMTASTWHLYWLCVDVAMAGGVGHALHAHAEAFARSRGGDRFVLETSSQPAYVRARVFYEHEGYRQVGRIPDFYKVDDDCILYCKELKP
jgi:ribosomal protein S18 acetylase RimI-like enzyme